MDDCKPDQLRSGLRALGLERYCDEFVNNGFDSWEALASVTESDLATVGVKLGHRRKLQRAFDQDTNGASTSSEAQDKLDTVRPRIYRRHPKPDKHAPARPLTAYVRFSNNQREVYKDKQWSFTDLTRQIGLDWRTLDSDDRQTYVDAAEAAKVEYRRELSKYRQTDEYHKYSAYLEEFSRHNPRSAQAQQTRRASMRPTADPTGPQADTTAQSIELDAEVPNNVSPDLSNVSGGLMPSPLEIGRYDEFHEGLYADASPSYGSLESSPVDAPMLSFDSMSETVFPQQMHTWPHDAQLPLTYLHSSNVWPVNLDLDPDFHI